MKMSLLDEIRDGAIDSASDLGVVLRKCLVLAARLRHEGLRDWARQELDGYKKLEDIPDYRIFSGQSYGYFDGGVKAYQGFPIPDVGFDETEWTHAFQIQFSQGVNSLESLKDREDLRFDWPDWMRLKWYRKILQGYSLLEVHVSVPPGSVTSVLNAIRNRLVDFVLAIEEEFPDAGEHSITKSSENQQIVDRAFQVHIHGNHSIVNVANESVAVSNIEKQVIVGDLDSLHRFLETEGFNPEEFPALDEALSEPEALLQAQSDSGPIKEWASTAARKGFKNAGSITLQALTQVAIKAALAYAGLE